MPAEASIRFRAESQQARREIQTLRGTLAQLNKTLAEQRNQLIGATAEEQKNIRAHITANNALKTTIRSQIEQTNLRKQAIAQTQREAKERERLAQQQVREAQRVGKAQEQAARRASAAQSALIADLTRGARVVYQELSRLTTGFVSAAADMETFRNSVQAVTRDTTETNRILADLLQLTVELVGIETGTLISYAGRLMAAGLSAEEAITAIRGVTERIAEQGKAASVTARVMEQVTQSFNAGIATMQDFRPILREMPTFWRDASNALGVQITNLEDFRQAADAAGGNTQALLLVLAEMGRASEGANLDTLNAQIDILSDQARLLQAELGEHLIPAIVAIAKEVNVWIERFRNLDDRAQAAIAWAIALATALTGLSVIVGTATLGFGALSASLAAITGVAGVAGLTAGIGGLTAAFVAAAPFIAVGGIIVGGIALLAKAIRDTSESARVLRTEIKRLDEVTRVYNLTTGQLEVVTASQSEAFAVFQQRVKNAQDDVGNISNLLRQNRMEQEGLNKAMAVASGDAIPALQLQLRGLEAEGQELSQALDDATNKLQGLQFEVAPDESTLTDPIESLEEQLVRAVDQVIRLRDSFSELSRSEDIQAIESAASDLTGALRRELTLQLMDAELTAAERLDLELTHAREVEGVTTDTQNRITEITKEKTEEQTEAVQRQTDARIASAERARAAEVAGYERAAQSGASYKDQLEQIGNVSGRRAFVDLVGRLQEQGLSFDEARAKAEPYFNVIGAVRARLRGADAAYGNFASTLVRESDRSADAVANLLSGVQALADEIGRLSDDQTFRLDSSLERSLLNEQRYFEQNPIGLTIEDDQQRAGQQGREFVNALSGKQDREAEKAAIEAQRESIQLYNDLSAATVDFTGSLIDLKGETNLADHAFQDFLGTFGRLATGDFTALLDIPIQLLNISRQAAAERAQGARDRSSLYEDQFGDFSRFGRNLSTVSGVLGIPESPELRDSFFFDQAGEFENVIAQSTTDFSDGIKNALLSSVVNLERDIRPEDIAGIFQSSIDALGENLDQSQFNLNFDQQLGRDTADAYQSLINDTTTFYQAQIDAINLVRQATGNLSFGDPEALARQLQAETNQLRLAAPPSGPQNAQQFLAASNRTRGLTEPTDDQERGLTSAEVARVDDEVLAAALQANQESIAAINTAIAGLDASISQSNDPAEIEQLLQQIAIQIPERYRLRREALQQQLDAGDITQAAFDTSLAQLGIEESAEVERNSDAMLANALLINRQAIEAINVQVAGLENAISQSNDPAEIINLLQQIATQIPEIYRLRRDALSEQFAAGEITLQAFNTSIAQLNIEQSAAVEQNSDQQLANTLLINQQTTEAVSSAISDLENRISQSSDPAEIARLLMEIAEQIPEIYRLRRNALSAQYAAGEITLQAINTGMANLNIEQAAAVERNADAQLANVLVINQQSIDMLSAGVSSLENAIAQSNDLTEIEVLLMDIAVQIPEIYQLRRDALQAQYDAGEITLSVLNTGLAVIDTEQAAALEQNSDAQLANALRMNQEAVESLNVGVSALENSIAQSSDPTEIATLLQQIAQQIPEIYQLRREALQSQYDAGEITLTALNTGIASLNIEASAALEQNSDAQLANALLINQQAVEAINAEISGIENAISQSNDPAEIANLLQQIAVQIPEIYQLRRETLQSQYDEGEITLSALQTGLAELGIEESAAVERNSDAMLANALSMNQLAAEAINTHIAGLEERISSSNDPVEIATLLQQVAQQIPEIYRLRRAALQRQFNEGEITLSALQTGLAQANIDESAALERNSDQQLANTLGVLNTDAQSVNTEINSLSEQIRNSNDPVSEIVSLVVDLQTAVMEKYRLQREVLQKQLDAEELTIEAFNAELGSINLAETSELAGAAALGGAETDNLRRTSNALLQNALQRAQFNLTGATSESDFETRRRELLRFIEEYYDAEKARIDALMLSESQLRDQQEDTEFARQRALQQATDATNRFAEDRIQTEERLQDRIEDLRDDAVENEADRQQALQDLAESHQDRLTDIEEDGIRRREDLQRESQRSLEDLRREFQEDQFDVGAQLDRGEITREEAEQQISDLTREFLRDSGDLQRRQRRALEDQGIREERQQEDAAEGFTKSQQQIETEARATATAIQTALTPLLTEQRTDEVAEKQVTAADKQIEAADAQTTAADDLGTVVTGLKDSDIPGAIDVVRQSAEASLGISSAISALPSLLESSFERIFDDLQETIVEILQIESGIQGGVSQYLLDTLIESEGRATGIVGKPTAAFALQSLGINPEQFAPPEVEMPTPNMSEITAMVETDVPLDVKVINPDDLYDPAEIERLREDGLNNREIGVHLREIASLTEPTRPDVSMRGLSDLTARIGAAEALSATREVPTSFTADTVNVSGSVVNVSGGNRSGSRESETPQSRFPVEGDELRADITLEFPDGTIQEINNQMLRLKQQDRT